MGTKIQGKPLYASLVAVVVAVVLAMAGIGSALALPDDEVSEHDCNYVYTWDYSKTYADSWFTYITDWRPYKEYNPLSYSVKSECPKCGKWNMSGVRSFKVVPEEVYYSWNDGEKEVARSYPFDPSKNWAFDGEWGKIDESNYTCTLNVPRNNSVFQDVMTLNSSLEDADYSHFYNDMKDYKFIDQAREISISSEKIDYIAEPVEITCPLYLAEESNIEKATTIMSTTWISLYETKDGITKGLIDPSDIDIENTPVADSDDGFNTSNRLTLHMDFKATGIQATGFKDYQEAFAAMNS